MELARVLGRVVCSVKSEGLEGVRLLLIQPQDAQGRPQGDALVAADGLQAGPGDLVSWTAGREAALTLPQTFVPVDCAVISIVDQVWSDRRHL